MPLRIVTPIIGGGVDPLTPDRALPVRVTALRGALRWWWRSLQPKTDLAALRKKEWAIFGGVDRKGIDKDQKGLENTGSALRLAVKITQAPRIIPSGLHRRDGNFLKTLPDWRVSRSLAYALFPLQATDAQRREWLRNGNQGDLPTPDLIETLEFDLELELDPARWSARTTPQGTEPGALGERDKMQVLGALRWWLHWGGIGARTRRGFGAVQLRDKAQILGISLAPNYFENAPGAKEFSLKQQQTAPDRPCLFGAEVWIGPKENSARQAHEQLVESLKSFRQSEGFARDPGRDKRPGRSRWPEPDLMKAHVSPPAKFAHQPFPAQAEDGRRRPQLYPAPRAAFGLPIVMHFKDQGDDSANGQILPALNSTSGQPTDRWASPVIMRPVWLNGAWHAGVLILRGAAVPQGVRIQLSKQPGNNDEQPTTVVMGQEGSRGDIRGELRSGEGDTLTAYTHWLVRTRSFQKHPA